MRKAMTDSFTVRLDHDLKKGAESILAEIGLKPSDAIRTLYRQIILHRGIPYEMKIPNTITIEAMKEADKMAERAINGEDLGGYASVDEMFESL